MLAARRITTLLAGKNGDTTRTPAYAASRAFLCQYLDRHAERPLGLNAPATGPDAFRRHCQSGTRGVVCGDGGKLENFLLTVGEGLARLSEWNCREARLVSRLGGLNTDDAAEVLGVSARTAGRDWQTVRAHAILRDSL